MHVSERDIVVTRALYFGRCYRRRALDLAFLHEESVRQRDIPEPFTRLGHAPQRPVIGGVLDQRAAPYSSRELGKIERGAVGLENQMQIFRKRARRGTGVDRAFVMSVVIAGDHDHRHPCAADSSEREGEALFSNARGIEQVADYQQQVGAAVVRDVDDAGERVADLVAKLHASLAGAEGVGFEMDIGSMNDPKRTARFGGQMDLPVFPLAVAISAAGTMFRSSMTSCR